MINNEFEPITKENIKEELEEELEEERLTVVERNLIMEMARLMEKLK